MTLPDWKAEDYYFANFEPITYSGLLVNAPIELKVFKVLKYLNDTVIPDAMKAILNGAELSGLLLVFSIVDYLAEFYSGKSTKSKDIVRFMEKYFPSVYQPYLNDIYQHIRCGLVHNLSLLNPWYKNSCSFKLIRKSKYHLQFKDGFIIFSMVTFVIDTSRAIAMYLHDVISEGKDSLIRENFEKRFNRKDAASAFIEKTNDDYES